MRASDAISVGNSFRKVAIQLMAIRLEKGMANNLFFVWPDRLK